MIFNDFRKALAQLSDPQFRRVLWMGIGLTFLLLIAIYALLMFAIQTVTGDTTTLPFIGEVTWFGDLLGWAGLVIMIIASWILMIPVASAITSLFLDDVAQAVEDVYYPGLPSVARVPFFDGLRDTVNFLGVLIGANILAFGAYFLLPFAAVFIFFALNGFLLGREYFQLVAVRHLGMNGAKALRAKHRREVWLAGCLMALPLGIPLLNLVIPILGAATFTHLFHRLNRG